MPKLRNIGAGTYANGILFVLKDEVVEVGADEAKYLLSDDCPGKFEVVKDEAKVPAKPAAKEKV